MKKCKSKKDSLIKGKKRHGFTLIELLAVIIILGVLLIIAIPSVTLYIQSSRKDSYITTATQYIGGVRNKVNSAEWEMYDLNTTYYVPIKCVSLEKGGQSPFGEWEEAYVVVTYDGTGYDYYWTSRDSSNMGVLLAYEHLLNNENVISGLKDINTSIGVGEREEIIILGNDCSIDNGEKILAETAIAEKSAFGCPKGYVLEDGSTSLTSCHMEVEAGKYVEASKSSTPTNCDIGTYSEKHTVYYGETSSCTACTEGTYQDKTGQSSCKTCESQGCLACDSTGKCSDCLSGYYLVGTKCVTCPTQCLNG